MGHDQADLTAAGQVERGTTLSCECCRGAFTPKNRNGVPARYCSRKCLDADRNARRLKAAASLNQKKAPKRPRKPSIRTLDQLSAAEGLPEGCYSAGALGRIRRGVRKDSLDDLLGAASRLGLTEEGETLKAARAAAAAQAASKGAAA